jgi:hypothetical protein
MLNSMDYVIKLCLKLILNWNTKTYRMHLMSSNVSTPEVTSLKEENNVRTGSLSLEMMQDEFN